MQIFRKTSFTTGSLKTFGCLTHLDLGEGEGTDIDILDSGDISRVGFQARVGNHILTWRRRMLYRTELI